jgi:hypothetical protein
VLNAKPLIEGILATPETYKSYKSHAQRGGYNAESTPEPKVYADRVASSRQAPSTASQFNAAIQRERYLIHNKNLIFHFDRSMGASM